MSRATFVDATLLVKYLAPGLSQASFHSPAGGGVRVLGGVRGAGAFITDEVCPGHATWMNRSITRPQHTAPPARMCAVTSVGEQSSTRPHARHRTRLTWRDQPRGVVLVSASVGMGVPEKGDGLAQAVARRRWLTLERQVPKSSKRQDDRKNECSGGLASGPRQLDSTRLRWTPPVTGGCRWLVYSPRLLGSSPSPPFLRRRSPPHVFPKDEQLMPPPPRKGTEAGCTTKAAHGCPIYDY